MEQSGDKKDQGTKNVYEVTTFSIPFAMGEIKKNISISTNTPSKEEIVQQAVQFHLEGNISKAVKWYQYCINQGFNDYRVFSNYGGILKNVGKLPEAEISIRKAIELNPDIAMTHCNLGTILKDLGKLQDAEISIRKAIELNPDYADAHSNLGTIFNDLGKLQDAEISIRKAIKLNPDYAEAHYNLGRILIDLGKLQDAKLSLRKAIELKPDYAEAYLNLGSILKGLGKLQDAEISISKAIEIKPDYAEAYSNLGGILSNLGKLQDAELFQRKAIELKPDFARAYFSLTTLQYSNINPTWKDNLFSEIILKNQSKEDQIHIYFARANILHKEKNYEGSYKCLHLANTFKLELQPSKPEIILSKSRILLFESYKKRVTKNKHTQSPKSIFIVGMPRSGSTLLESILTMNTDVDDLGESDILEESFLEQKEVDQELTIAELYWKKANSLKGKFNITTNKNLYNYQYAGIISNQIPNAKIIHCYRNPLDNILSIYRAHFASGNEYSSSLVDCARVYLNQEDLMTEYKNRFRSTIYNLNYDMLVSNPNKEIKSLITWLGWKWNDSYLTPHLNPRSVFTRSNVEVRSPINSNSIGRWKNYKEMLKPAIEILTQTDRYRDLIS